MPKPTLAESNNAKVDKVVRRLAAKLRQMEADKSTGELIARFGVQSGGVARGGIEQSETVRPDEE